MDKKLALHNATATTATAENYTPMTNSDINKALSLFALAIKEQRELFTIEGHNPIKQNAYTSSSDFAGIYFPNSFMRFNRHTLYTIACVAKHKNGKYCLILSLQDEADDTEDQRAYRAFCNKVKDTRVLKNLLSEYLSIELEDIVMSYEERKQRADLQESRNIYAKELKALETLERAYKKDGKPFARLEDNFPNAKIFCKRSILDNTILSVVLKIHISSEWVEISLPCANEHKEEITADDLAGKIEMQKEANKLKLKEYDTALKKLHAVCMEIEKMVVKMSDLYRKTIPYGHNTSSLSRAAKSFMQDLIALI